MHGRGVGGDAEDCLPSCLANVAWQDDEVAKALDAWANSKDQCDDALMMPCLYPACMQNVPFKFQDQRVQQRYLKCSMEGIMKKKDSEWQERVELAQEEARAATSGEVSMNTVDSAVQQVLERKCPHCGQQWLDFDDCMSLKCHKCNNLFCAMCDLKLETTSFQTKHQPVLECAYNITDLEQQRTTVFPHGRFEELRARYERESVMALLRGEDVPRRNGGAAAPPRGVPFGGNLTTHMEAVMKYLTEHQHADTRVMALLREQVACLAPCINSGRPGVGHVVCRKGNNSEVATRNIVARPQALHKMGWRERQPFAG